jgi:hypothetical protein
MNGQRLAWASTAPNALLHDTTHPKVTAVAPLDHGDPAADTIRFRAIMGRLGAIAATAPGRPDIDEIVAPIPGLVADLHPLDHSFASVALFASSSETRLIPLHGAFDERLQVGPEYHLLPLVEEYDPAVCHVLTLTRGGGKLYRADRWSIDEIEVPDMPASLDEITEFRVLETQLQLHRTGSSGESMFHGQGVDEDDEIEPLRMYLRRVADAIAPEVEPTEPLAVIGPGRLPSVFASVSDHREFRSRVGIHPDGIGASELSRIGRDLAEGLAVERTGRLLGIAADLMGTGRSETEPAIVLQRAREGRIDQLIVDPRSGDATVSDAVVETLRLGGTALPAVGADQPVTAILRY